MVHPTRSSLMTSSHLSPNPQHLLAHEESKPGLDSLKEYNGAIYKWTQQLLSQIQRPSPSTGELLKPIAQNDDVHPTTGGPSQKEFEAVSGNKCY